MDANGFIQALRRMGARVQTHRDKSNAFYRCEAESSKLNGRRISGELTATISEMFPFLALAAAYASGQTVIRDALFLRDGYVDIIEGTIKNLKTMGVKIGEIDDGIVIEGAKEYDGAEFDSFGHPAIAMAFSAAAVKNNGESIIKNAEIVDLLWPDFYYKFETLIKQEE
jgi:3-phosphoshikimate 1-carboxyvinyltransferase